MKKDNKGLLKGKKVETMLRDYKKKAGKKGLLTESAKNMFLEKGARLRLKIESKEGLTGKMITTL